jgi:hypothetical protein
MPHAAREIMYCNERAPLMMALSVRQTYDASEMRNRFEEQQLSLVIHPLAGQKHPMIPFDHNLNYELFRKR